MSSSQEESVYKCLNQMATVLGNEISTRFIPIPSKDNIVNDVIHGSRGLQERLRWKSWFRGTRMINKLDLGNSQDADAYSINTTDSSEVLSAAREQSDGLGTGLGP